MREWLVRGRGQACKKGTLFIALLLASDMFVLLHNWHLEIHAASYHREQETQCKQEREGNLG